MIRPPVLFVSAVMVLSAAALPALAQSTTTPPAAKKSASPVPGFGSNSKEPIQIDADRLEVFSKEQRAVYTGNVVAIQGDTTIKSAEMTVFYERQGGDQAASGEKADQAPAAEAAAGAAPSGGTQLKRVEARGGVSVVSKDQVATGNEGVFDRQSNKIILTGNVALSQGENVTKGEKLIYDTETGVAIVESGGPKAGRVRGVFVPGDDDKNTPKGAKPGAKPSAKPDAKPVPPKS